MATPNPATSKSRYLEDSIGNMSSAQFQNSESILPSYSTIEHSQDKRPLLVTAPPPEIHNLIFKLLDPVASTCLGLTCKKFYEIHRSFHGSVSLATKSPVDNGGLSLCEFLDDWICQGFPLRRQISLVYCPAANKFRDLEGIRTTFVIDVKQLTRRLRELEREIGELFEKTRTELTTHASRNTIPLPSHITHLREMRNKVEDDLALGRKQRSFLRSSFEYSVLRVEAKAVKHGFALNNIAKPKSERFSDGERPFQRLCWH